jgi:hypothetical protein
MKTYWITWAALLAFTVLMLWADGASQLIPRTAFVIVMLSVMLVKVTLIGANFMHLRDERASLVITVVVGLLVTGTILFILMAPDAARIHGMGSAQ